MAKKYYQRQNKTFPFRGHDIFYVIVSTPHNEVGIVWRMLKGSRPKVVRIYLSQGKRSAVYDIRRDYPTAVRRDTRELHSVKKGLRQLLQGQIRKRIPVSLFDWSCLTNYERHVLAVTRRIPRGCVATYTGIARQSGNARASRAVGNVLAKNPFPLAVPCHRVIRSDGTLGGFQKGSAFKRGLLAREGVRFDQGKRSG